MKITLSESMVGFGDRQTVDAMTVWNGEGGIRTPVGFDPKTDFESPVGTPKRLIFKVLRNGREGFPQLPLKMGLNFASLRAGKSLYIFTRGVHKNLEGFPK